MAWIDYRPEFRIDPYEVEHLIEAPLHLLLAPATRRSEPWTLRGQVVQVPYYAVAGQTVWGATAMMLGELLSLSALRFAPK